MTYKQAIQICSCIPMSSSELRLCVLLLLCDLRPISALDSIWWIQIWDSRNFCSNSFTFNYKSPQYIVKTNIYMHTLDSQQLYICFPLISLRYILTLICSSPLPCLNGTTLNQMTIVYDLVKTIQC